MSRCPSQDWDDYAKAMDQTIPDEQMELELGRKFANEILDAFKPGASVDQILKEVRQICIKRIDAMPKTEELSSDD